MLVGRRTGTRWAEMRRVHRLPALKFRARLGDHPNEVFQKFGRNRTAAHTDAIVRLRRSPIASHARRHVRLGAWAANVLGIVTVPTVAKQFHLLPAIDATGKPFRASISNFKNAEI